MKPMVPAPPQWFASFTDFEGFLVCKRKDKLWDRLPDKLFSRIYRNAGSDIEGVRSFLMVSNQFNLLNISYLPLIKQQKMYRDFVFHTLVSHALLEIGRTYLESDLAAAEQYLANALLCDEYCMQAYPALTACYRDLSFSMEKIVRLQERFKAAARHYQYDRLNAKQREYCVSAEAMGRIGGEIDRIVLERMSLEKTRSTM